MDIITIDKKPAPLAVIHGRCREKTWIMIVLYRQKNCFDVLYDPILSQPGVYQN
jgi:hypothetical protein